MATLVSAVKAASIPGFCRAISAPARSRSDTVWRTSIPKTASHCPSTEPSQSKSLMTFCGDDDSPAQPTITKATAATQTRPRNGRRSEGIRPA